MSGEYVPEWNIGICRPGGKGVHFGAGLKEKVAMWLVAFFHGEGNESVIASALEKAKGREGGRPSPGYIKENAARLLDIHGDSVLRLAYSYMHNMQDAEDILQETLIRYMQAVPEFENESHARAWLLRVAANLSKNRIEYNRYRMADELNEELVAEEREDLSFVWEAVKSLPVTYRETIHLFYREGFKTAQIAEILGEKESTVRSHLKRGREKLREILKEAYDFEE